MGKRVLIVGGVAGGASCAARLRRLDEDAEIILFERGEYISYANCGLPYHIGDVIKSRDALLLQTPEAMRAKYAIDVRVRSEVPAIARANKKVTVKQAESGETYEEGYDTLVLSTGNIMRKARWWWAADSSVLRWRKTSTMRVWRSRWWRCCPR
jgi:NADPH-dependent 2,4-dienoyl-CoA reductase/sulfur reductase-like enzyme